MYRKGDGRRLATFTSLPHSLTHSPLGLSSPHCQRTDSRSRQIICECGALSQPSPSPLPRCRRSRRRPSFSIPHPLTLTHTLPSQLPHPHIHDSTLCPSGIYTCCRCEPQPRGCVATASWGAPAMSMPGCIPVWGLLPAPPPSLALSASLSLCQDLSLVSRPSAGCFATKKVSITV